MPERSITWFVLVISLSFCGACAPNTGVSAPVSAPPPATEPAKETLSQFRADGLVLVGKMETVLPLFRRLENHERITAVSEDVKYGWNLLEARHRNSAGPLESYRILQNATFELTIAGHDFSLLWLGAMRSLPPQELSAFAQQSGESEAKFRRSLVNARLLLETGK